MKTNTELDIYGIDAIYHMTHIDNLFSILENGLLSHNNSLKKRDISNNRVNNRRNIIHSYVPFYFNPRNPMLYYNIDIQDKIVILEFSRDLIAQKGSIFTDGNAASNSTRFYNRLEDLSKLNWSTIRARRWNTIEDGKREIMAEILVPNRVDIKYLQKIVTCSGKTYNLLKPKIGDKFSLIHDTDHFFLDFKFYGGIENMLDFWGF